MPVLALDDCSLSFGHLPLLDRVTLRLDAGERVSVVGRNGCGKSTLLRIVAGELLPDGGTMWRAPGTRVARLEQDVPVVGDRPVFDVVAEGLAELGQLVAAYHHAAVELSHQASEEALAHLGRLQHELEERDGWRLEQRVEMVLGRLGLDADARVDTLSGGWRRRVALARALVAQPDVLLLDEPTNHLDIDAIAWLERYLADFPGALIFVTHDRAFLRRLATRIIEVDRGRLTSWLGDYDTFLRRKEDATSAELAQDDRFDKRLAQEEAWLRQGIKARRTRNEGRVRALLAMRKDRAARRERAGAVRLDVEVAARSGQLVFEAEDVTKSFGAKPVVNAFSCRIMRGDRVGLIGPNGSGKTTLLRVLLGELTPDSGDVRIGANVQVAYFDQQREQLDPNRTAFDIIGDGNDTVTVNGVSRHVNGYLRDFLFPPERANSPVRALSGGERNRLLLARLFTRPSNVLVLDEPTNDLDLDTLELLEAQLADYPGTMLIVSHDRTFLDNIVTSAFVFEGDGLVREYVGGYSDWMEQKAAREPEPALSLSPANGRPPRGSPAINAPPVPAAADGRKRLGYMEQRELDQLPARIEALEAEERELETTINGVEFYREAPTVIAATLDRLERTREALMAAYARWDELEGRSGAGRLE